MSDMLLSEPLHMLEKGEYTPLVALIFWLLKYVTRLKTLRYASRKYGPKVRGLVMRIPQINKIAFGHHRFVTNRVDERLAKSPEQPDIWSLVTAESKTAMLVSQEERYSIANELMIAGTETSATALSKFKQQKTGSCILPDSVFGLKKCNLGGILYYLLRNPQWLSKLSEHLRSQFSDIDSLSMAGLQADKLLNAIIKESMRM